MTHEQYFTFGNDNFLSDEEKNYEKELNSKNKYGLSDNQIMTLTRRHKKARKDEDYRTMAKIEYRLTDINFHWECRKMHTGEYAEIYEGFLCKKFTYYLMNENCNGIRVSAEIGKNKDWVRYSDGNDGEKNYYCDALSEDGRTLYCDGEVCRIKGYNEEAQTVELSNYLNGAEDGEFTIPLEQFVADFGRMFNIMIEEQFNK